MKHRAVVSVSLLLFCLVCLAPAAADELKLTSQVVERTLPNGLKVLFVQRPHAPLVRCILAYRVGSVNERPGITGISHFLEHMMFKGTYVMGVKPGTLEKDLEYDRKIDEIMAKVVEEESKIKGRDEAKIIAWKKEVSDLIARQREETMVGEELWAAYQEAGGTGINASTGQEITQYYVTLPKNRLELFLALEADRMANAVFREFYAERDVLVEERRMSENSPGFFFNEQLMATFYAASPYSWSVVGWMSDLSRITKAEMTEYYSHFYRPDNATLVLAGDVEVEPAMRLIEKHFGPIPAGGRSPRVRTEEPCPEYYLRTVGPNFNPPYVEKRVHGKAATTPSVRILFHIPPIWHDDLPALSVLGRVMSAQTGRMYLDMVLEKEHAAAVMASASNSMYDGMFTVAATVKERNNKVVVPHETVEQDLWRFIEEAKTKPVENELLQRIKNSIEAEYLQSLRGTGIAGALARMETVYRWQHFEEQFQQRMAVTADDLMRVAAKYLTRNNSVTGILERDQ
jgi:predicted Zn-dependent peptidase